MKEKEKLYEEMVYTMGSSDSSGSSGSSSGSSNSSTRSGNISLPLGNLTLNSSISQTASMTNVDYSASCPNAANITVTLNHYPSDAVAYSAYARQNSISGTFTDVAAGGYMLKAVAKQGTQTKSTQTYTYIRENQSQPLGNISLNRTISEGSSLFDVNYSAGCSNADNICVSLNNAYSNAVVVSNSVSNNNLSGTFRNIVEGDYLLKATASKRNGESKSTQVYTALQKTYNCSYCKDRGWIGSVSCSHCEAYLTNLVPVQISAISTLSKESSGYDISISASCANTYLLSLEIFESKNSSPYYSACTSATKLNNKLGPFEKGKSLYVKAVATGWNGAVNMTEKTVTVVDSNVYCNYCNDSGWIGYDKCTHCNSYETNMAPLTWRTESQNAFEESGKYDLYIEALCPNATDMVVDIYSGTSSEIVFSQSASSNRISAKVRNALSGSYNVTIIAKNGSLQKSVHTNITTMASPAPRTFSLISDVSFFGRNLKFYGGGYSQEILDDLNRLTNDELTVDISDGEYYVKVEKEAYLAPNSNEYFTYPLETFLIRSLIKGSEAVYIMPDSNNNDKFINKYYNGNGVNTVYYDVNGTFATFVDLWSYGIEKSESTSSRYQIILVLRMN